MDCLILNSFEYSRDGHNLLPAAVGKVIDIPDSLVAGLAQEGFVGDPKLAAAPQTPNPAPRAPLATPQVATHTPAPATPVGNEKMMKPWENKDAGSTPSIAAAGKAPKSK